MDSLIKIDGKPIANVANNLIEKLSSAVGWIATRFDPEGIATNIFINEIQTSNLPPLMKAALVSNAKKTIREYSNQKNIVRYAMESLDATAKPQDIEDDWLTQFMDHARLISEHDIQLVWGRILSEECMSPSRIPKSLLYILPQMDKIDAKTFTALCAVSAYTLDENGEKSFFPIVSSAAYFIELGLTYDRLSDLQSLGLIEMDFSFPDGSYHHKPTERPIVVHYFDETMELPDEVESVLCGNVIYTKAGEALCHVIESDKRDGFFEKYCKPLFKKKGTEWIDKIFNEGNTKQ